MSANKIVAVVDLGTGIVHLNFAYDPEINAAIKQVPGTRWDKAKRRWLTSVHGLPIIQASGLDVQVKMGFQPRLEIPQHFRSFLRPYQIEGAERLTQNGGFILTFDLRVGKTSTAIAAAAAALEAGAASMVIVTYPAGVKYEWEAQLQRWARIKLETLEGLKPLASSEIDRLRATPYLFVGCHYEILGQRVADLHRIAEGRPFALIADEIQRAKNRKAGQTIALKSLAHAKNRATVGKGEAQQDVASGFCVYRWGLTGTPMRNNPRDMFSIFDFAIEGSMGPYWTFAKRYADAHIDDHNHWDDKGSSNEEELAERFRSISFRKTRADVRGYLPKVDQKVILCELSEKETKKYLKLERHTAVAVRRALEEGENFADRRALEGLAQATMVGKVPAVVQSAQEHCERGVKVLIGTHFHDSLRAIEERLDSIAERDLELAQISGIAPTTPPHFCAGGWLTPLKRKEEIEKWKACPGPAILLANTISSGVGIDLSAAEVMILAELTWVPADLLQFMARIEDVHQGTRTVPPIYELYMVKNTVDEAMGSAVVKKIRTILSVVGEDETTAGLGQTLRNSGAIGPARLGLPNTDMDTVQAMLESIRTRLMADEPTEDDSTAALAADATEAFSDGAGEQAGVPEEDDYSEAQQ